MDAAHFHRGTDRKDVTGRVPADEAQHRYVVPDKFKSFPIFAWGWLDHCNFLYSALACFRMGMSGSASVQSTSKCWSAVRTQPVIDQRQRAAKNFFWQS
jgi:hypothetical protein